MSRLDEIKAREAKATRGPWLTPEEAGDPYKAPAMDGIGGPILDHEGCQVWPWRNESDMVFAYKAREDIPWLIAQIEHLQRSTTPKICRDPNATVMMDENGKIWHT